MSAIEDQFNNVLGIGIQVMLINEVDFGPNDAVISEVKDIEAKIIDENPAFTLSGKIVVSTAQKKFKEEFGLSLRIYDGKSFAGSKVTLASIKKSDAKGGEFSPKKNMLIKTLELKMQELYGIKVQVAGSDDSYLCNNDLTLSAALIKDKEIIAKKS